MLIVARIVVGALVAIAVVAAARRSRALSTGGAVAAAVLGTAAVAAGWSWAALLITFFVASSALSRLGAVAKIERTAAVAAKTGPRDARQVLANGLPFLIAASGAAMAGPDPLWMAVAGGSLAASAADTWATEIGTMVGRTPHSILTGRPVAVGESGGISVAGIVASLVGALFVAAVALVVAWPRALFVPIVAGGIVGSLIDSVAGAAIQRRSWCDACRRSTEMRTHICGTATRHSGGLSWLENDEVNLLATMTGALVAAAL